MTIQQVVTASRESGMRFRRAGTRDSLCIDDDMILDGQYDQPPGVPHYTESNFVTLCIDDLLADDWELIGSPGEEPSR